MINPHKSDRSIDQKNACLYKKQSNGEQVM